MRDFISVEHKRLTNKQIFDSMPQGCTHYALPRVDVVRYYLIVEDVILSWDGEEW